jgi:hypothetical protein
LHSGLETSRSQSLALDTAREAALRRTSSEQLRRRRAELRRAGRGAQTTPTREQWSRVRDRADRQEVALQQLTATRAWLTEDRPPLRKLLSRHRHRQALRDLRGREEALAAELARARAAETTLEVRAWRQTADEIASNHDELAELRLLEEELARRKAIERRLDRPADRALSR